MQPTLSLEASLDTWKSLLEQEKAFRVDIAKNSRQPTERVKRYVEGCRPLLDALQRAPHAPSEVRKLIELETSVLAALQRGHQADGFQEASCQLQKVGYLFHREMFRNLRAQYDSAPFAEREIIARKMLQGADWMQRLETSFRQPRQKAAPDELMHVLQEALYFHKHVTFMRELMLHCQEDRANKTKQEIGHWKRTFWEKFDQHTQDVLKSNRHSLHHERHCRDLVELALKHRHDLFGKNNHSEISLQAMNHLLVLCPKRGSDEEFRRHLTEFRLNFGEDVALIERPLSPRVIARAYQEMRLAGTQSAAKFVYPAYLILFKKYRGLSPLKEGSPVWTEEEAQRIAKGLYDKAQSVLSGNKGNSAHTKVHKDRGELAYKTAADLDSREIHLKVENLLLRLGVERGKEDVDVLNEEESSFSEEPVRKRPRQEEEILPALEEQVIPFKEEVAPSDSRLARIPFENELPRVTKRNLAREERNFVSLSCQMDEDRKREIGRWGEEAVYTRLLAHYQEKLKGKYLGSTLTETTSGFYLMQNGQKKVEVIWHNKGKKLDEDWGGAYDFTILKPQKERKIEVKTTASPTYRGIYLSGNEYNEMMSQKERYTFFRVYGAGTLDSRIEKIKGPSRYFSGGLPIALQGKMRSISMEIELP